MAHLPQIIVDLAMLLLVAGVTTILFQKLNQPLVLGYIIAGFITGPNFIFFPTVSDEANIQTWAEIGVIFLLFALGLEFSFYKLKSVGMTAFIGTTVEILGMLCMGYACGRLLGWSDMDSLFLGGMLSMSSTTIIIKAFDDLNLRGERFTENVFGMLIVEDIAGIVMMVLLSTLAVAAADVSATKLLLSVMRLIFFLVLWFVAGMYLVPTFFKRAQRFMNNETLLVTSLGLCLGMVVLATRLGFSSALGAFIMGSLIAEAPNAEKIEHLVAPVKDLFGAVFFVSVGMLVEPSLLVKYALPIVCVIIVTIVGKLLFSTGGVLAAGQNLRTSLHCGFSLAQIGEFSFIIASLGMSLGVTSEYLYPIVVAVSVTTTFTTPFFIKAAEPAHSFLLRVLPPSVLQRLERYTDNGADGDLQDSDWREFLKSYALHMLVYVTLLAAILIGAHYYLLPYLRIIMSDLAGRVLTGLLTMVVMSPILRALLRSRTNNVELFSVLWVKKRSNHIGLVFLLLLKIVAAAGAIFFVFNELLEWRAFISTVAALAAAYFISTSDWLLGEYLRIESRFLINMNEKHILRHRQSIGSLEPADTPSFDEELQLGYYTVLPDSPFIGKTLQESDIRYLYGCNILQVKTDEEFIDMPGGSYVMGKHSSLLIIGTREQYKLFALALKAGWMGLEPLSSPVSLREFMLENHDLTPEQNFLSCAITIDKQSHLIGKSLKTFDFREKWHCLVIGIERGAYVITNPNVAMVFEQGDLLWVLGKQKMINALVFEEIL